MKGYKGMNENMRCRGMQFEIGKSYHVDGKIGLCKNGLHFCKKLSDVFKHYPNNGKNRFFEVEADEDIDVSATKCAASDLTIIRELTDIEVNRYYYGNGFGYGYGFGYGNGFGYGYGNGFGYGNGYGNGFGYGNGDGYGYGNGFGYGYGDGYGYGFGYGFGNNDGNGYGNGFGNGFGFGFGYGYGYGGHSIQKILYFREEIQ